MANKDLKIQKPADYNGVGRFSDPRGLTYRGQNIIPKSGDTDKDGTPDRNVSTELSEPVNSPHRR